MRIIKKILSAILIIPLLLFLLLCMQRSIRLAEWLSSNIITYSGNEYTYLASEPTLRYSGKLEFKTTLEGEPEAFGHMLGTIQTGLYSIKDAEADNILVRYIPNNEWYAIYRKSALPPLDYSADNLSRLVFVDSHSSKDSVLSSDDNIIIDPQEIAEFLSDVRSQKTPEDAGLYSLVIQPNGFFKNCYQCGAIYGYFEEEPYVCLRMDVTSYNDLAYSVDLEGKEYVLPEKWAERLRVH